MRKFLFFDSVSQAEAAEKNLDELGYIVIREGRKVIIKGIKLMEVRK